jgi:hypothetical protein
MLESIQQIMPILPNLSQNLIAQVEQLLSKLNAQLGLTFDLSSATMAKRKKRSAAAATIGPVSENTVIFR